MPSTKNCFLLSLLFLGLAPFLLSSPGSEPAKKAAYGTAHLTSTLDQQNCVRTLLASSLMEHNPIFAERDLVLKQSQETLKKSLNKRGEDLTPWEQIELMRDTFYLDFADAYLAENVLAIGGMWILMGFIELSWRTHNRRLGLVDVDYSLSSQKLSDFFKKNEIFLEKKAPTLARDSVRPSFFGSAAKEARYALLSGSITEFFDRHPKLKSVMPAYYKALVEAGDSRSGAFAKQFGVYINDLLERHTNSATSWHKLKDEGLSHYQHWSFPPLPEERVKQMRWASKAMMVLPTIRRIVNYMINQHAISYGRTPRKFLEDALKELSPTPKLWQSNDSQENSMNLHEALSDRRTSIHIANTIIKPAWDKHRGNPNKVWAELATQGNLALHLARSVDPKDEQSIYRFVMALHGGVLPDLKPTRRNLAWKAFEHHMLKRIVLSAVGAMIVPVLASMCYLFTNHQWLEFCKDTGLLFAFVPAAFSIILGSSSVYFTAKGLFARDNTKARADYATFLKRLHLEGAAYGEQFYWSWFLPFWKLHSGDILELETLFKARAQEVMEKYTALKAFEAAENPAPEAQPQAAQKENDSYKEAFARAAQALEQDQAAAQATSEAAQQSSSPESSLPGDTAAPTPEASQPVTTHPQSQELLIPIIA